MATSPQWQNMRRQNTQRLNMQRLHMDNALASYPKPLCVQQAMQTPATPQSLHQSRLRLSGRINAPTPDSILFTPSCTSALTLAIQTLRSAKTKTPHTICSTTDHVSVFTALSQTDQTRIEMTPENLRHAIRDDTALIAITHADNVTGRLQPIRELSVIAHQAGIPILLNAAQTIGRIPIDVQADGIDLLAAPTHKQLLGPKGIGFLYISPPLQSDWSLQRPVSNDLTLPTAPLLESLDWLASQPPHQFSSLDQTLSGAFIEGLDGIPGLKYFGPQGVRNRIGIFSVRIDGITPSELSERLETEFGITTNSGLHDSPTIHESIGTASTGGTTRFSFGPFLSPQDVSFATDALAQIAQRS